MFARSTSPAGTPVFFLRRWIAAAAVALLLLLSATAAAPALHHWLHADGGDNAGDNCAVVLFASGLTLAAAPLAVAAPAATWRDLPRTVAADLFLASPRYLRQPERGPPAA